jgi:hypothetical protein
MKTLLGRCPNGYLKENFGTSQQFGASTFH